MQVIQIKTIEFEDLMDGVYKLEKRLDKIDEKLSGSRIKYVPLKEALKILNIQRKTADNWHKSGILKKKYVGKNLIFLYFQWLKAATVLQKNMVIFRWYWGCAMAIRRWRRPLKS